MIVHDRATAGVVKCNAVAARPLAPGAVVVA